MSDMATSLQRVSEIPESLRIGCPVVKHRDLAKQLRDRSLSIETSQLSRPSGVVDFCQVNGPSCQLPTRASTFDVAQDKQNKHKSSEYNIKTPYRYYRMFSSLLPHADGGKCVTCGTGISASDMHRHSFECNECKKKRKAVSASLHASSTPEKRRASDSSVEMLAGARSNAGKTAVLDQAALCHRCEKAKRPTVIIPSTESSASNTSKPALPPPYHIASQHIMFTNIQDTPAQRASIVPRRKPVPEQAKLSLNSVIDIAITPPTATSEQPEPNILTNSITERNSSLENNPLEEKSHSRQHASISSMASSISHPLSTYQDADENSSEVSPSSTERNTCGINGTSGLYNTGNGAVHEKDARNCAKSEDGQDFEDRPISPFSSTGEADKELPKLNNLMSPRLDLDNSWKDIELDSIWFESVTGTSFENNVSTKQLGGSSTSPDIVESLSTTLFIAQNEMLAQSPDHYEELARPKSLQRAEETASSTRTQESNNLESIPQFWNRAGVTVTGTTIGAC